MTSVLTSAEPDLRTVPIEQVRESKTNPRKHFEPVTLAELAASIRESGVLNPLLVRGFSPSYELVDGARRFRASQEAGLREVPVLVRDLSDRQVLEIQIISNLQRDDLNALEEAQGFVALMTDAGYDVPKIAERVGRSVKYVYDRLKLLQLVPEAKTLLLDGTITPGHGILLARLSKEDQARALAAESRNGSDGGVLEAERVSDSYFPGDPELELDEGPRKARSVRELAQWIDRNVRFVPDKVDQSDLAFDLPQTADLLQTAATSKLKVVKITREYRVPDEARDEKERTYGYISWKRADGEPEETFNAYGAPAKDRKPSKTCDHSVVGLVVAGPGRGEAFLVCVNKEKCSVHWAQEMKERARGAKERERYAAADGKADTAAPAPKKADPKLMPYDLRERWIEEELSVRAPGIAKAVKAIIKISDEICWNFATAEFFLNGWTKVGKRAWGGGFESDHVLGLEHLIAAELPGRFRKGQLEPEDGPAARSWLAWQIWLARDSQALDESVDKAVAARWLAHRKAAAKDQAAAQTSAPAKGKKRASAGGRK
ncbi:MAG: ParB/RepB/Spo0J family partition protein [Gemmatimonadales bacterium]